MIGLPATLFVAYGLFGIPGNPPSHFRGGDMRAEIDANGVVRLEARTRWPKGPSPYPFAGIDSSRFGAFQFTCESNPPPPCEHQVIPTLLSCTLGYSTIPTAPGTRLSSPARTGGSGTISKRGAR